MCCLSDDENTQGVGRHGKLKLVFKEREGKTLLQDSYATMPMHFLPPLYPDDTGWAYAYLVNPTGGFVGGDRVELDISLGERAHVFLTTQSATRVYRSTGACSNQDLTVKVGQGSVFEYLPGYVIPFADSLYRQTTRVRIEKHGTALIADSFTTGRRACGEHLMFGEYASSLEIEYEGKPIVYDRFVLRPKGSDYAGFGLLESHSLCSSIYLIFDDRQKEKSLIDSLRSILDHSEGIFGGVSALWSRGLVIRLIGTGARHLNRVTSHMWSLARRELFPGVKTNDHRFLPYQ